MNPNTRRRPSSFSADQPFQRRHRPDYVLLLLCVVLLVIGLIVVYSISPGLAAQKHVSENYFVTKQLIAIALGFVMFGVAAVVPLNAWRHLQKPLLVGAIVATLIALVLPASAEYPAHRWIRFGGLSLQSVELVKFVLLVSVAAFLVRQMRRGEMSDLKKTMQPLAIAMGVMGVIIAFLQKDLGSTGVIVAMMGAMAYVAGLPLKRIAQVAGIIAIGVVLLVIPSGYRRARVANFVTPERDCQNTGYQACQALISVGSGGIFGLGLGKGVQAFGYLPEAANDSIFAIYAEKFGFLGTALLVGLFGVLFSRLVRIIERAPDDYTRLLVVGVLAWLSTQAIINIGAMIGLLPLKGITLPFISYGGTSLIFVMAAIGLVFQVSRYTTYGINVQSKEGTPHDNSSYRRGDRRPHYAAVSRRP